MKKINAFWFQKSLVYVFIAISILLFLTGLGFMTKIYPLFFNGTSDMFNYYKDIQVFNRALLKGAIIFVVLGVFMLGFDLNKPKNGLLALAYSAFVTYYVFSTTGVILRAIPHYLGIYNAFDFSVVQDYTPSTFAFKASNVLSMAILVVSILITVVVAVRFFMSRKKVKGSVTND